MRFAFKPFARTSWSAPLALLGAIAALLIAAPSEAAAQTRTACYVPASGTVYMIKEPGTPTACHSGAHVQFTWSTSGQTGPQGPQGATGPAGPTGPTGASGPLSGLEFHSQAATLVPNGSANYGIFFASCSSATKSVITFGHQANPGGTIFASRPATNGKQVLWAFQGEANSTWVFYWSCADGVIP